MGWGQAAGVTANFSALTLEEQALLLEFLDSL